MGFVPKKIFINLHLRFKGHFYFREKIIEKGNFINYRRAIKLITIFMKFTFMKFNIICPDFLWPNFLCVTVLII